MHEPGLDYFNRFKDFFSKVEIHKSERYSKENQLYIYRGKEGGNFPLSVGDGKYSDIVPVCYV